MTDYSERVEAGLAFIAKYRGEEVAAGIAERLNKRGHRFNDHSVAATYGDIYLRDGLDPKWRQLATIAILGALGGAPDQVTTHTHLGIAMGLTPVEITEVIVQVSAYAGAPRGSVAMNAAMKAFDELGIEAP
jgi:4-carboxymuconolactone decarboxylase